MPQLQFKDIVDREKGKTGFVLGLGPSLRNHVDKILNIQDDRENYGIVSCNNFDHHYHSLNPGYWMLAQPAAGDWPFCITNLYPRINAKPKTVFLYTDCLDLTPKNIVADLITGEYLGYDQRHFNGERCGWKNQDGSEPICCNGIIPGRLCIQEEFMKYTGVDYRYGCGDTVSVHMLALCVMLGFKTVYVTGIDLDYSKGYANNTLPETQFRTAMGMSSINNSPAMVKRIIEDLKIIKASAENVGTSIYCMNKGLKISDVFEYKTPEL